MADSCRACLSSMVLRDNADEALLGRDGAFALFFRRFFSCTALSTLGGCRTDRLDGILRREEPGAS